MCNHLWKIHNDVRVCVRCGLTVSRVDGQLISFDRELKDMPKKGRRKREK